MKKISLMLFIVAFASCDRPVYKRFDEFKDNRWPRAQVETFAFDIAEPGDYDLNLHYSHVYGTPNAIIPLTVTLKSAAGAQPSEVMLKLLGGDGQPLSDCAGDVCDLSQPLFEKKKLGAGPYVLSVQQHFGYDYLPNAIGIGIEVRKSKSGQ